MPANNFNINGLTNKQVIIARKKYGHNTLQYKKENGGSIPAEVEAKFREADKKLKEVKQELADAQKKIEELESNILKERRNSKLKVIHDERIIRQSGPKLTNINEEQMEE